MKAFITHILPEERLNTSIIYSIFVDRCCALGTDMIRMSGVELVEILDVDRGTVQRAITRLLDLGKITRVNGTKLHYKVELPNANQS